MASSEPTTAAPSQVVYAAKYDFGVDDKRRVQIPAKWRPGLDGVQLMLVLWRHEGVEDQCILVLPPEALGNLMDRLKAMPFGDPNSEALRRNLGEKSDTVTLDKAGRICLPEWMAGPAGIQDQAVLIGMFDRFQIWEPGRYRQSRQLVSARVPDAFATL